ncbi:MAG: sigma-70 family RNA polymerase sigma factor [Verrucomicrobiota bacterium]
MPSHDQTLEVQKLFVEHLPAMKRFVFSLLPNRSEADDITQDVFLTVTTKANEFVIGSNFKAWAFAIARFKVLEHLRRAKRDPHSLSDSVIDKLVDEAPDADPENESLTLRALAKCIARLAPKRKQAIEMQYHRNFTPTEIAEQLGWGVNSVNVTLSRARADLRSCVQNAIT